MFSITDVRAAPGGNDQRTDPGGLCLDLPEPETLALSVEDENALHEMSGLPRVVSAASVSDEVLLLSRTGTDCGLRMAGVIGSPSLRV